tara:strand:+ start:1317 stop:1967 length:651 start_codon:yes stop_codon:yes gene_type:complete
MIEKGLIVSCQAEPGSAFNNTQSMIAFAKEAERGGAVGLRLREVDNIEAVSLNSKLPIIGLTKSKYENGDVWITPSWNSAKDVFNVGANYVAMDATGRGGYYDIELASAGDLITIVGDLSNLNQAEKALEKGCKVLTTALSGYTSDCNVNMDKPDYKLLEDLVKTYPDVPIMAEGRYWERDDIKKAFDIGAHNVVVGSAISRPHLITKRLMEAFNE